MKKIWCAECGEEIVPGTICLLEIQIEFDGEVFCSESCALAHWMRYVVISDYGAALNKYGEKPTGVEDMKKIWCAECGQQIAPGSICLLEYDEEIFCGEYCATAYWMRYVVLLDYKAALNRYGQEATREGYAKGWRDGVIGR